WLEWLPRIGHEPAGPVAAAATEASGLTVEVVAGDGRVRVALAGELDLKTAAELAESLEKVEADSTPLLLIDLRGLLFMDSSGLQELFLASRRAREQGRRMVVVKGSEPIDRVLDLVRADAAMETVDDPTAVTTQG